jgi:hypothetical protein
VVAGGGFSTAGGGPAARIARWNGVAWTALGTGMSDLVNGLAVMPNGDLIAGGRFATAGGVTVNGVARWDGANWNALGTGVAGSPGYVVSVVAMPNGDVVIGGNFDTVDGVAAEDIARWNGTNWSALGPGLEGNVNAMTVMPGGDLIATGQFQVTGNLAQFLFFVGRWNGSTWSSLGSGLSGSPGSIIGWAATTLPSGELVVAGDFTSAGGTPANNIAKWDGTSWSALDTGVTGGAIPMVSALAVLPDGELIGGGSFMNAGSVPAVRIARWGCTLCPGDVNGDQIVDLADLTVLLGNFGTLSGATLEDGDLTGDGAVDLNDLTELLSSFGVPCA